MLRLSELKKVLKMSASVGPSREPHWSMDEAVWHRMEERQEAAHQYVKSRLEAINARLTETDDE